MKLSPEVEAAVRARYQGGTATLSEAYQLGAHDQLALVAQLLESARSPAPPPPQNAYEAGAAIQALLVTILEEECASESAMPLFFRLFDRVVKMVLPASPRNLTLAERKADWFVDKCMTVLSRRDPKKMTHDDIVSLVADISSPPRRERS